MQWKKYAALGLAVVAPMALSGCLLLPGAFTSEMTVMKSGDFSFSYKGEIQLVGLANLLNNDLEGDLGTTEFTASCYGEAPEEKSDADTKKDKAKEKAKEKAIQDKAATDAALATITGQPGGTAASRTGQEDYTLAQDSGETSTDDAADAAAAAADAAAEVVEDVSADEDFEERDCTATEIAEQKKEWDDQQERKKKDKEQAKKMFAMLLGGVDPEDPKTIERFTKEVERLASWNKVEHLGNGVFRIDYSTKGKLGDDFAFPLIPRYALGNPMVYASRWDNGRVRIEAPTFHNDPDMSMLALMGAGGMMPGLGAGAKKANVDPLEVKGTFTIRTDAQIIANNTDEGPTDAGGGLQVLTWEIGPRTYGPPMALLKLGN
jgi:hypothetical protein